MEIDFFINDLINDKLKDKRIFVANYNTNNTIRCYRFPRIKRIINQSKYCYFVKRNGYFRVFSESFDKVYSFLPCEVIKRVISKAKKNNYKVVLYTTNNVDENIVKEYFKNIKVLCSNDHQDLINYLNNNKVDIVLFDIKEELINDFLLDYLSLLNCSLIIDVQEGIYQLTHNNKQQFSISSIDRLLKIIFKQKKSVLLSNKDKFDKLGFVAGYYYIPQTTAQAISTFKILKNSKFKYDVYSSKNKNWCYNADTVMDFCDTPNVNVIYSDSIDADPWCEQTADYFMQNKDKYQFLMTRVMPDWSHNVGLKVKQKDKNVFWIASFGDPIHNNPIGLYQTANANFDKKTANRLLNNLDLIYNSDDEKYNCFNFYKDYEKKSIKVFELSDLMIFNNKYQMHWILGEHYKEYKDKCYILPHSYDPDFYVERKRINKDKKIRFLYLGHTDNCRNINTFVEALNKIKKENKDYINRIELLFVGNMYEETVKKIETYKLNNIIKIIENMDYLSSLDLMQECDFLLLIDAKLKFMNGLNVFFASKLSDYLGSKKLILGLCDDISTTRDILNKTNNIVCNVDDIDKIKNEVIKLINNHKPRIRYNKYKKYNAHIIIKDFDKFLLNRIKKVKK